jgi:hypothetical protein
VLVRDDQGLIDLLRGGQQVFNVVPLGSMKAELDARIVKLAPRRDGAGAEQPEHSEPRIAEEG